MCALVVIIPISTIAEAVTTTNQCGDNLYWQLSDDGVLTITGTGAMYDYEGTNYVQLPSGSLAYRNDIPWADSQINKVILSEGITHIGNKAFYNCSVYSNRSMFKEITIPSTVTSIGSMAFADTRLEKIYIPDNVATIGARAFANCDFLVETRLPNNLEVISEGLVECSENLQNIEISQGVKIIEDYAFFCCFDIKEIFIPQSVETISYGAFMRCINLQTMFVLNPNVVFDEGAIEYCDSLKIYGYANSTAEAYATEKEIPFVTICTCGNLNLDITDSNASCENDGYTLIQCNECGTSNKINLVEAYGHDYQFLAGHIDRDTYVCANCGEEKNEMHEVKNIDPDHENLRPYYNIGTNKQLSGDIYVVALFLSEDTSNGKKWKTSSSDNEVERWTRTIKSGLNFIKEEAAKRDVEVNFTVSSYTLEIPKSVMTNNVHVGDNALDVVAKRFLLNGQQFKNATEMRQYFREQSGCEEVVFLLMSPYDRTPFSMVDNRPDNASDFEEYCVLYKYIGGGSIYSSAIAHEVLHLFGAFDLYGSSNYFGTHYNRENLIKSTETKNEKGSTIVEIMRYTSPETRSITTISDVTAYLMGWTDVVPSHLYNENFYQDDYSDIGNCFFFSSASVALGSNLSINYYVHSDVLEGCSDTSVVFSKPVYSGDAIVGTESITVTDYATKSINGSTYYVFTYSDIKAYEMNTVISATIHTTKHNKKHVGSTAEYSVAKYAYNMLGKETTTPQLKTLLVDMLNYGTAAQIYFNYNTNNLINAGLSDEQQSLATQDMPELESRADKSLGSEDSIKIKGISLSLEDRVEPNIYFTLGKHSIEDVCARVRYDVNGETQTIIFDGTEFVEANGGYKISLANFNATQMRTTFRVDFLDKTTGERIGDSYTYSIESYVVKHANRNDELSDLLIAMMKYGDSAKAFFG